MKEVFRWFDLDIKAVNNTVIFIESKEMVGDALAKPIKTKCKHCKAEMNKYT